jgi:hypothetical protein
MAPVTTRWVETFDQPNLDYSIDPVSGARRTQTYEFGLAAAEEPRVVSQDVIERTAIAQRQQELIVAQARQREELARLGGFRPNARPGPRPFDLRDRIAVVDEGLMRHSFYSVPDDQLAYDDQGRIVDKRNGRPLMTRREAEGVVLKLQARTHGRRK